MSETVLQRPLKRSKILVEFSHGNPVTFVRYTDYSADVIDGLGNVFTSTPNMKVDIRRMSAMFNEEPFKLVFQGDAFTDRMSGGEAHSLISLKVSELIDPVSPADPIAEIVLFQGEVSQAIRNYEGISNQVQISAESIKNKLEVPLGLQVTHNCNWIFGGVGCQLPGFAALAETGTLTVIDRRKATVTGLTSPAGKYWHRGYLEFDAARIGIRDWDSGTPTEFICVREIPLDWLNETITAVPGCDKTIETCRTRWNNEEHYGGAGFAIPPYNPIFETNE